MVEPAPRIGLPCLQLSKETGSRKCLLFLSSPFISQVGKGKKRHWPKSPGVTVAKLCLLPRSPNLRQELPLP